MLNKIIIGGLMLLVLLLIGFIVCSRIELASLEKRFDTYQRATKLGTDKLLRNHTEDQATLKQLASENNRRLELIQQLKTDRERLEKNAREREHIYREIDGELRKLADSINRSAELNRRKSELFLKACD